VYSLSFISTGLLLTTYYLSRYSFLLTPCVSLTAVHIGYLLQHHTMSFNPRPPRPAATDYFNPTEQIELLQSIKAKAEKSATSTPQEPLLAQPDTTNHVQQPPTGTKPVDFKAHELSLREKLEKAKADREAKAKAEGAKSQTPTAIASESPQTRLVENKSVEQVPAGPPPPPMLNTTTPTSIPMAAPPFVQAWTPNMGYPHQTPPMMNYPRPPFPYPQAFPPTFGLQNYPNGQSMAGYPQWGQFPNQASPGIPAPPNHPNQGATLQQLPPNNLALSQSPPNPVTQGLPSQALNQAPMNVPQSLPSQGIPSQQGLFLVDGFLTYRSTESFWHCSTVYPSDFFSTTGGSTNSYST
jgi:hypothetical protein